MFGEPGGIQPFSWLRIRADLEPNEKPPSREALRKEVASLGLLYDGTQKTGWLFDILY